MKKGIGSEIYNAFKRVKGYPLSFFCIALSIVLFIWGPETSVSLKYIVTVGVLFLLAFAVIFDFGFHCFSRMTNVIPVVKQGLNPPPLYQKAEALLLLSESEVFAIEAIVSIYYKDESYEPLIGSGLVLTIQENGLIQVIVERCHDDRYKEIWDKVRENNASTLEKLIIKPLVTKTLLISGE